MKKIGLLLVFGLLLGILASCGEKPDTEKPTETEQESAEPSILDTLPTTDLKGEKFVIMGFSGTDLVIYDADQTGTKVVRYPLHERNLSTNSSIPKSE